MLVNLRFLLAAMFVSALTCSIAQAQWKQLPTTGSPEDRLPDRTTLAGQSGLGPQLTAEMVDKDANAKKRRVVVQVQTDGVEMVDPVSVNEPNLGQAHIEYRLDNGPAQQTTSKTETFETLPPGWHRVYVRLLSNDNHPIGKPTTLSVHIP